MHGVGGPHGARRTTGEAAHAVELHAHADQGGDRGFIHASLLFDQRPRRFGSAGPDLVGKEARRQAFSVTPALSNVAISRSTRAAASTTFRASTAPVPSPSLSPRSRT